MGQAKQRGSREERIAQAKERAVQKPSNPIPLSFSEFNQLAARAKQLDPIFGKLTTPSGVNEQVASFCAELSSLTPIFLTCSPEPWSRQHCCDLNVREYIRLHGGQPLNGYIIWYTAPRYIEAERHCVWTDGNTINDVSFVASGEKTILFVPDNLPFDDAPKKIRRAFNEQDNKALCAFECLESFQNMVQMPDEQAWNTYPSYEDWLSGKRMGPYVPTPASIAASEPL